MWIAWREWRLRQDELTSRLDKILRKFRALDGSWITGPRHYSDPEQLPMSSCTTVPALRDGVLVNVPTNLLVRGDIVMLSPGDRAPAHLLQMTAEAVAGAGVGAEAGAGRTSSVASKDSVNSIRTVAAVSDTRNYGGGGGIDRAVDKATTAASMTTKTAATVVATTSPKSIPGTISGLVTNVANATTIATATTTNMTTAPSSAHGTRPASVISAASVDSCSSGNLPATTLLRLPIGAVFSPHAGRGTTSLPYVTRVSPTPATPFMVEDTPLRAQLYEAFELYRGRAVSQSLRSRVLVAL
eukprot:UC1_evm1s491